MRQNLLVDARSSWAALRYTSTWAVDPETSGRTVSRWNFSDEDSSPASTSWCCPRIPDPAYSQ